MNSPRSLSRRGPDYFSISYVQARPIGLVRDVPRTIQGLQRGGFETYPLDYFYDGQLDRSNHIGRAKLKNVSLKLIDRDGRSFSGIGTLHILVWSVGFVVLRLTFNDEGLTRPETSFRSWFKVMHSLEHDLPRTQANVGVWAVDFGAQSLEVTGGARRFFDLVGCAIHEFSRGRTLSPGALSSLAVTPESSLDYLEALVRKGELRFPYVCTFGSYSEMLWASSRTRPREPDTWIPTLMGSGAEGERMATDIDAHSSDRWWYLSEFQSILVDCAEAPPLEADVYDIRRASMIEYIAYRRGALMAIQRETQGITAERQPVPKFKVADWMWLASAVTDDYVLGGWSSTLFERVRQRFHAFEGLRDIFTLEAQVSKNIDAFQGRLDAESDRIGVVTGVLFGIVAATALVPLGQLGVQLAFHLRGSYSNFPDNYPFVFLGIIVTMLAIVGIVSWFMLRRTRSLKPPRAAIIRLVRRDSR